MTAVRPAQEATHVGRPRAVAGAAVRHRARVPMPRPVTVPERPVTRSDDHGAAPTGRRSVVLGSIVAVALLAVAVATLTRPDAPDGPGVGEAFVDVHGEALVRRAEGGSRVVTGRVDLGPGDSLTMRSGRADLELADGVTFDAVAAIGRVPATEVRMGEVPRLVRGSLLVAAPTGARIGAGAGDGRIDLASGAVARFTSTAALRVAMYSGSATVSSAGATRLAPALRFVDVVGAGDITRPRPLDYRAGDRWDEAHLGPALDLDRQLDAITEGLTAGRVDPSAMPERVRRVLDAPPAPSTVSALVAEREVGFGNAIAVAAAGNGSRPFVDGWTRAIAFHDAGARWGLVALDLGVEPDAVVDTLLASLEGTPVPTTPEPAGADDLDAGVEGTDPSSVPPTTALDEPTTASDGGATDTVPPVGGSVAPVGGGAAPPVGGGPTPTVPPVVGPVLDPLNPVVAPLAPVLQPVTETVGTVGGGLVGTVETTLDPLDPLLGGVTDPLLAEGGVVPGLLGGLLP